ncbi:MAG: transglutaminaseTgpA domain-containing protein [Myxococcales bacterium]|nr:transglutaminaseTgpA domain-containing protein [Myxococcales bacterium]
MTHHAPPSLRQALLIAIGLFAVNSRQWVASAVLLVLWLGALLRLRVSPDRMLQIALALIGGGLAWVLAVMIELPVNGRMHRVLGPIGQLASLGLLLIASSRLYFTTPWAGVRASAALILMALLFLADGQFGPSFIATSVVVLLCLWRALHVAEPARAGWGEMDRRARRVLVAAGLLTGAVAAAVAVVIPRVYPLVASFMLSAFDDGATTGFSSTMALGAISAMQDNDARVLRVHGARPDHLRGIVYDEYRFGRWVQAETPSLQPLPAAGDPIDATLATEIESVGGDRRRYFLPLLSRQIHVEGDQARVDEGGNLHVSAAGVARRVRFVAGARQRAKPADPHPRDTAVPEKVRDQLQSLARAWTRDHQGAAAQLAALADRLRRDYRYSLTFERERGVDPVLDFLKTHREGHCEYFASAMALLARSLDIPTRVIGGYRVVERNPLGDYYIVREQHAHAWVEAWLPGQGWQTYDPTPASDQPSLAMQTPWLSGILDYLGHLIARGGLSIGPREMLSLAGLLFLGWMSARLVRAVRTRRSPAEPDGAVYDEPLPGLIALLTWLEAQGIARGRGESVEAYAERVAEAGMDASSDALRRYAAFRYGKHGNRQAVELALRRELS